LLVRGLLDSASVEQLVDDIDHAFEAHDAFVGGASELETAPWFVPFEPGPDQSIPRTWIRQGDGVLAVDSPRTLFDLIETFEQIGIRDLVSEYLGEPPVLLANKWTLRRVPPGPDGHLDWHQDGAFLGADVRTVDVWLALSHCGVDAPGLDVVGQRFDGVVEVGTNGASFDWTVSEDTVQHLAPGKIFRPVFEPGDALILDHFLLHRTAYHVDMTRNRYAVEAWFAAPSAYPPTALPIAY
ncbi:MAG: phytanoyl-CoA dioxygenase family protein, partial [Dehalococcoidia bacterium]